MCLREGIFVMNADHRYLQEDQREYNVTRLRERHDEILRRILLGQENTKIAKELGITPQTVSNVRNSELARAKLTIMAQARDSDSVEVAKTIQEVAPKALKTLTTLIERTNSTLEEDKTAVPTVHATNVARDILDRAGHGAVNKSLSLTKELDDNDIEIMKKMAYKSGQVVDAEVVEEKSA